MADIGQITVEQHDRISIVSLRGEHDLSNVDKLALQLEAATAGATKIVVDLSDAKFIDSSVISAIINAAAQKNGAATGGGVVAVAAAPTTPPRRLADLVTLAAIVPVFDSRDAAISYAENSPPA